MIFLKNNQHVYGIVARILHWISAAFILLMLLLGFGNNWWSFWDTWHISMPVHKVLGVFVLFLILMRCLWASVNIKPLLNQSFPLWYLHARHWVHRFFYGLLLLMPFSGWLMSSYAGKPPQLGSIALGLPVKVNASYASCIANIHTCLAYVLVSFIGLHVVAVCYHHFIRRDNVLNSMLLGKYVRLKNNKTL